MKKTILLFSFIGLILFSNVFAQSNETLLTINDLKVSKDEFVRIYEKNKTNLSTGEVTSVEEYLELFINFKLKVLEAKSLDLDKDPVFLKEFEGYKKQLSRPYLLDKDANEKVIKEAYKRMTQEVRASHILVKLPEDATPEDTLEAFNKALEIKRRIFNGESFEIVAKGSSDDPSVKNNGGDLGYFTVFQMIYPFENVVYNSKVGDVSNPVRTRYGYHIVKVTDKRKANGQVKVAHIMIATPRGSTPEVIDEKKKLSNEIYHRLKQGEDFGELAKQFSDDKGSARNYGELPWFGVGRMVKEFEKAAFNLSFNGEISQPIQTGFGWHIIKRIDRKSIESFEDSKEEIIRKIGRDKRADVARKALVEKLKLEYNFREKEQNIPVKFDSLQNAYILNKKYFANSFNNNDTLFVFLDRLYTEKDFYNYISEKNKTNNFTAFRYLVEYENYIEDKILEVEENRLDVKYPDYKYLVQEYYEGMLLFEITDRKVWSLAMNDTVGLEKFYKENKSDYMWDERWEGSVYKCTDKTIGSKVEKIISKSSFGRKVTNEDLLKKFNSESEVLQIETELFSKGENLIVDALVWNINPKNANPSTDFIKGRIIKPKTKTLDEARGIVISDYQNYLDEKWIENLRSKYNINVNNSVLSTIK